MKTIVVSDSFKGTLSSKEADAIIQDTILSLCPEKEVVSFPFSDGGEGMLDVFKTLYPQAKEKRVLIKDAFLEKEREAYYLTFEKKAIIESAQANGITWLKKESNPFLTSTYGLGQLVLDALQRGYREFILGLGGSCTNDGGAGMLAALGMQFFSQEGIFLPSGGTTNQIISINNTLDKRLKQCHFTILSDVDNPLLGKQGATYVFAKQKGAKENELPQLEDNMKHYQDCVISLTGKDCSSLPGAGAAGGLGFAFYSFFSSNIISGGEYILSQYGFDALLSQADRVITGEGKTDASSLHHKVISVIGKACQKRNVPCALISGSVEQTVIPALKDIGITSYYETNEDKSRSFEEIKRTAAEDLRKAVVKYIRNEKR